MFRKNKAQKKVVEDEEQDVQLLQYKVMTTIDIFWILRLQYFFEDHFVGRRCCWEDFDSSAIYGR